jgi:hypothetical protein
MMQELMKHMVLKKKKNQPEQRIDLNRRKE